MPLMAEGIEFAVVALICYGLVDWTYKSASAAGVAAHQMLMTQAFFFVPIIFSYGLITDTLVFDVGYAWGIAAGAFIFVAMYFFNRNVIYLYTRQGVARAASRLATCRCHRGAALRRYGHVDSWPCGWRSERARACCADGVHRHGIDRIHRAARIGYTQGAHGVGLRTCRAVAAGA
jgi:hypothetical protein